MYLVQHSYRTANPDGTSTGHVELFRGVDATKLGDLIATLIAYPASLLKHPAGTPARTVQIHVETEQ